MLRGFEISAKILDEGFESVRIQKVGHGCLTGFEFLEGYGGHGWCLLWEFVRSERGEETENLGKVVFRRVYGVFRGQRSTELNSMWLM
jgi:hypothetical protein